MQCLKCGETEEDDVPLLIWVGGRRPTTYFAMGEGTVGERWGDGVPSHFICVEGVWKKFHLHPPCREMCNDRPPIFYTLSTGSKYYRRSLKLDCKLDNMSLDHSQ